MKRPTEEVLNSWIVLWSKSHKRQKEGRLTLCCEAVSYLGETFLKNDVIAEMDGEMMSSSHLSNNLHTK